MLVFSLALCHTHTRTRTRTHTHTHPLSLSLCHTHTRTQAYTQVHTHNTHVRTHTVTHANTHTQHDTHTRTHAHTHTRTHAHTSNCLQDTLFILSTKQAFFMLESGALSVPKNAKPSELIISKSPTYLNVLFEHHARIKTLSGMWDLKCKQWYVPAGVDIFHFLHWLS